MANPETRERFWEQTALLLLHPTQLLILEVLAHLEGAVSATALEQISGGQIALANWAYHLTRLEDLCLVEMVRTEQRRGAREKFYDLTPRKGDGDDGG